MSEHHSSNRRWRAYEVLLLARLKELWRDPAAVFWICGFPILLAFGLGTAFRSLPVHPLSIAIIDGPQAFHAKETIQRSSNEHLIDVALLNEADADEGLKFAKYDLIVSPEASGGYRYRYYPSRLESVLAWRQIDDALQSAAGRSSAVATSLEAANAPGARYIDFLIPGLLGANLMSAGMWGIGYALIEIRQRKLLKRLAATPMRRSDFALALGSSRLILIIIEIVLFLIFGSLVFGMRVMGSLFSITVVALSGAICFAALGLATTSRAQRIESVGGLINLVMMPMWILSGVFFSYQRYPGPAQWFVQALPLTALNDALRATILQGLPLRTQIHRLAVLAGWAAISAIVGIRWFRWTE
jgi:ABC-2 type transport system permease protein